MDEFGTGVTVIGGLPNGPNTVVGDRSIADYVEEDETLAFVIVGTEEGLVREKDDWKHTEKPSESGRVVIVITDRRVLFVVGDCKDPDVDGDYVRRLDHVDVDDVGAKDSLLSSSFQVIDEDDVGLSVTPAGKQNLEDAAAYIRRASMQWDLANQFLDGIYEKLPAIEIALEEGDTETANEKRQAIQNGIDQLGETSELNEIDLPALDADREAARERLEHTMCRGYWHRARTLVEAGDESNEDGDVVAALETYRDACVATRSMLSFGGDGTEPFDEEELDADLGPHVMLEELLDRLADCEAAIEDEGPGDGPIDDLEDVADDLDTRSVLLEAYEELVAAVAGGVAIDGAEAARVHAQDARQQTADVYERAARHCEEQGDAVYESGGEDGGREWYERAEEYLSKRAELAARSDDDLADDDVAELDDRIEEKIERSRWEWVGDG